MHGFMNIEMKPAFDTVCIAAAAHPLLLLDSSIGLHLQCFLSSCVCAFNLLKSTSTYYVNRLGREMC